MEAQTTYVSSQPYSDTMTLGDMKRDIAVRVNDMAEGIKADGKSFDASKLEFFLTPHQNKPFTSVKIRVTV